MQRFGLIPNGARRARRLTDTQETLAKPSGSVRDYGSLQPAGAIGPEDTFSNVNSYGGGLEYNRDFGLGEYKLTYSCTTAAGSDPGGNVKENQDSWIVKERPASDESVFMGVFDGHGSEGRAVSQAIATRVPKILTQLPTFKAASYEAAMSTAFQDANKLLRRITTIDADLSGSTGVAALLVQERLVVANLGDSRCIMGKVSATNQSSALALTTDHTPMDVREAQRIVATGGRIASFMYNNAPLGPPRVWLKDVNVPGLCMTRSFGDNVAGTVGVLDVPETLSYSLKPEDRYLVLMSDGIFEFMENDEVIAIVHAVAQQGGTPNDASKRLVREARRRWQEEEDDIIDDCTAMVTYITHVPQHSSGSNSISNSSGSNAIGSGSKSAAGRLPKVASKSPAAPIKGAAGALLPRK